MDSLLKLMHNRPAIRFDPSKTTSVLTKYLCMPCRLLPQEEATQHLKEVTQQSAL